MDNEVDGRNIPSLTYPPDSSKERRDFPADLMSVPEALWIAHDL
jgi:hypothetical protein